MTDAETPTEPETAAPEPKKESWWETLRFLLILFLAALLLRTFLFAPFSIPRPRCCPADIGDIVVSKWSYGYSRYSRLPSDQFRGLSWRDAGARRVVSSAIRSTTMIWSSG